MRTLVTGGAGFIGSHCVRALLEAGDDVLCVDDFNDYYAPARKERNIASFLPHPAFRLVRADVSDYQALDAACGTFRPDRMLHLAARAGVRPSLEQPFLYETVNVKGTMTVLEMCRRHAVKTFVFASSSSVYGNQAKVPFSESDPVDRPISPYAATKRSTELLAYTYHHLYGIACTALRFFSVYGPAGRPDMAPWLFTEALLRDRPIVRYGDGSSRRDFTYIDDVVSGVIAALDASLPYEIINLGNNRPVALMQLIAAIEKATARKARIVEQPPRPGDVECTYADLSKAGRLLGYAPKISIEEGISRFVDWYRREVVC
jgi:UDP-glucuronate 4-epimerase